MGKLTIWDLRERQAWPLDMKIEFTKMRIRQWRDHWGGQVFVSYSGGKDSTVLLDLAREVDSSIPAVYFDTGLEYPEARELAKRKSDVVIKPRMTFKQVIERYGYPFPTKEQAQFIREARHTKSAKLRERRLNGKDSRFGAISKKWLHLLDAPFEVSEQCCRVMKKEPSMRYSKESGRHPMIATMACESALRTSRYLVNGCNAFEAKDPKSTPMAFWTEHDVLRYIKDNGIEYASCYGEIAGDPLRTTGVNRTECMFCMFGVHLEEPPNRFQRMQVTYPKQYAYCMDKLGIGELLDYEGIPKEIQPTLFDENITL